VAKAIHENVISVGGTITPINQALGHGGSLAASSLIFWMGVWI